MVPAEWINSGLLPLLPFVIGSAWRSPPLAAQYLPGHTAAAPGYVVDSESCEPEAEAPMFLLLMSKRKNSMALRSWPVPDEVMRAAYG